MIFQVETGPSLASQFRSRPEYEPEPQSVIHIPTGFGKFVSPWKVLSGLISDEALTEGARGREGGRAPIHGEVGC